MDAFLIVRETEVFDGKVTQAVTITGKLNIGNWVDELGFDGSTDEAVADLAINGSHRLWAAR